MVNDNAVIPDDAWLAVPDLMELTGSDLRTVKSWLQDRELIGVRRGPNNAVMVPATFVTHEGPVRALRGTVTVLADSGFDDAEIIEWLHRPDASLPGGSAVQALRTGAKTEVRRRAQELAF